jgi:hypothetical protein
MAWQLGDDQQSLSEDASILNIFRDKAANALLILGEPGSGKTITLLDLAQQLLDEAEKKKNRDAPIPVVLNLSSWALKRQPLQDWLLAELKTTYRVPEKTGRAWLESDALLLLLDGLDEVAQAHRQACVKAINDYRQEHGLTGTAVCCRREEYENLGEKLDLLGATVIQPLTAAQADNYLKRMGKELKGVRKFLKEVGEEDVLRKWVKSPLFLYVTAMAYRGLSLNQLREAHTGNLSQLYDAYVEQMLERHRQLLRQEVTYTAQQVNKWLAYLAARLVERKSTIYYIEHMQADWLREMDGRRTVDAVLVKGLRRLLGRQKIVVSDRHWSWSAAIQEVKSRLVYGGLVFGLGAGLVYGRAGWQAGGLGVGLAFGLVFGLAGWLVGGLGFGLVFGLSVGLAGGDVRSHEKPNQGVWRSLVNGLIVGLIVGLGAGLVFGLVVGLVVGLVTGLSDGLVVFIKHFSLRRLLSHYDHLPWKLALLLEYAKERLFLQRVGGGYKFMHRTLMEYFAAQNQEQEG